MAGEDLELGAALELRFGRMQTALEKIANFLGRTTNLPRYASAAGQCQTDGAGNGLITLGPVPQGRRWIVHQMVIGGVFWSTSVSGSALIFILPSWPSGDNPPPLISVQDQASGTTPALPSVAFYGRGQFVVIGPNAVLIEITGGGSGVTYTASCDYVDEPNGNNQ